MAASYWDSTQRRFWEFTKEQLADLRQRKQDEERSLVQVYPLPEWRHLFIFFNASLLRLAKRLQVRQQAIATAQVYLKRFYCKVEIRRTNPYLTMTTALYLACKTEECPQHIRQIVQEAKNTWPDMHCLEIPRLGECEFYMISELSSQLIVHAPYRTLNTLQLELSLTAEEFIQAWTVVNDHYMTDLPLLYPPHVIAVAAVIWVLVLQTPAAAAASSAGTAAGANANVNANANTPGGANNANINTNSANNANGANNSGAPLGIGMPGSGSMTPNSLNGYGLSGMGGFNGLSGMGGSSNLGALSMNTGGMGMNMGGLNMGLGGMNMSMGRSMGNMSMGMGMGQNMGQNMSQMGQNMGQNMGHQNGGAPGIGGTQSSLPPPPPLHMSLSGLGGAGSSNTPGGSGTPGGAGGPGTPGLGGGAAGTPTTAGGGSAAAMTMAQANARAVVSAAMQPNSTAGGGTAPAEETVPADGGRSATLQWLFRWLTDSGLDLEATIDCTQEMISFYMAGEEYSEKQTREQVHRFIKGRGLDR